MLLLAAIASALQWLAAVPFDADTAYHVAVARMIREHGVLKAFPWTSFSWLADHYADKELLFHALLVPLAGLEWTTAARIAGAVGGTLALGALYAVLRAERVAWPALWAVIPVAASGYFAHRLALVRPHLLAIGFVVVTTWALARRRYLFVFAGAVLFPLCYVGWPSVVVVAALVEAAAWASGARPDWKAPAVAVAGTLVGILAHPNAANLLEFAWLVVSEILVGTAWSHQAGFALGSEYQPFDPPGFLVHALLPTLFALAALVLAWRRRKDGFLPLAFALSAFFWGALTLRTQRFIEYYAPCSVLALALSSSGLSRRALAPAVAAVSVAWTAALGLGPLRMLPLRVLDFPPAFEQALRERVAPGEQVFTCGWLTTGEMMLALPERKFMVALDPVLFSRKDPDLYRRWFQLVHEPPELPAHLVREAFGAKWVLCESRLPENQRFLQALSRDPSTELSVYTDLWLLVRIREP